MGITLATAALLVLALASAPIHLHALIFTLPSGRVKCITEDLRSRSMSVAHYRISPHDRSSSLDKISLKVSDPKGETVHLHESVESGQFSFVAAEMGPHSACFWSPKFDIFASVTVEFAWMVGVAARDWPEVAKKGKIDGLESELKRMEESIHLIHEEMVFFRKREEEMRKLVEMTNSSMDHLSLLSLFVCLSVAGLQLWHLNTYFKREKIL